MKNVFFAIAMIFAVALTSCQNTTTDATTTAQDSTQVGSTVIDSTVIDSAEVIVDTATCTCTQ
jgi:outer membrane lipoprotein SlyB